MSGRAAAEPPPILSRHRDSRSRLRYQNKSTRARNPASYAGYKILCTSEVASAICENVKHLRLSLRSWRDFARECFCFGSEAVRGLVKSRVEFPPAQIRGVFLIIRSPVHANFGLAESTETSMEGKRFVFRMRRNA